MAKSTKNNNLMDSMPHNLEAEQALLGCILIDNKIQVEASTLIKSEDFYAESHKNIFEAMVKLIGTNQPVDIVTLSDSLEKEGVLEQSGGIEYLMNLSDTIPSGANFKKYADIIKRDSMARKLILGAGEIIDECKKSTEITSGLTFAEKTIFDIANTADTSSLKHISNVIPNVMNKIDELSKPGGKSHGIKTKYRGLDAIIKGLHNSDLMILAARPAVGKTSFAMNIVENVALQGYSCAVFSLEMSEEQLTQRMMCSIAGVSMEKVLSGTMGKAEWIKITKAKDILSKSKIYIDDSSLTTPRDIMSKCRRQKLRNGLDFVVIDYLQLMNPDISKKSDSRQNEITEISRNLKILAKEIDVPVLCLSQLSRAVETRKGRPQLSDLRESGAIEQDADIVMFIHRPDKFADEKEILEGKVEKNVAEILVEKHRSGPTGMVKLYFKGECTKFLNISENGEIEDDEKDNKVVNNSVVEDGYSPLPPMENSPLEDERNEEKKDSIDEEIF